MKPIGIKVDYGITVTVQHLQLCPAFNLGYPSKYFPFTTSNINRKGLYFTSGSPDLSKGDPAW